MKSRAFDKKYNGIMALLNAVKSNTSKNQEDTKNANTKINNMLTSLFSSQTSDKLNFIDSPKYSKLRNDFLKELNKILIDVKKADSRLANVKLVIDKDSNPNTDENKNITGEMYMFVKPNELDKIYVNVYSFINSYPLEELNTNKESFEKALSQYINIPNDDPNYAGQNLIQHECAHIIDMIENKERKEMTIKEGKPLEEMHNETFNEIRNRLNEKTGLDK